jgi:hypothetical protein
MTACLPRLIPSVLLLLSLLPDCSHVFAQQADVLLQAVDGQRWMKGNMHTHSLWSDGDDFPENLAKWYRDKGYQFLVFTDHNTLLQKERWFSLAKRKGSEKALQRLREQWPADWIESRGEGDATEIRLKTFDEIFARLAVPQEYLLIQGEEITDRFGKLPVHMCATNTTELLPPTGGDSITEVIQQNINAATSRRERSGVKTLVHLNHPNFGYAVTAEQLMKVVGENFFELYNGHPTVHNSGDATHAGTERMWDIINSFRLQKLQLPLMYALGTDDGHNYFETAAGKGAQPGRGWVVVLAKTLEPDAIVDALEAGRFYSSSGVSLKSVRFRDGVLRVEVQQEADVQYQIQFIGTDRDFDQASRPATDKAEEADTLTRVYSEQVGRVYAAADGPVAEYRVTGKELYVRAVVTSSKRHPNPSEAGEFERAWVQPITVSVPAAK